MLLTLFCMLRLGAGRTLYDKARDEPNDYAFHGEGAESDYIVSDAFSSDFVYNRFGGATQSRRRLQMHADALTTYAAWDVPRVAGVSSWDAAQTHAQA